MATGQTTHLEVYLCTGSLDFARRPISIESTATLKIVTAVGLSEHIGIKKQSVLEEKCTCNHTSWVAVVTPTDRPKSVRNRCLIELFCGVVCVVTLPF